jgi:hypothetical protein
MSNYSTLYLIAFFCTFLVFLLLPLVPLKKDVESENVRREEEEKAAKA